MHCQCFNPPKTLKPMSSTVLLMINVLKKYILNHANMLTITHQQSSWCFCFRSIRVKRQTRRSAPTTLGVLSSTRGRKHRSTAGRSHYF